MKRTATIFTLLLLATTLFAQGEEFKTRHMLKRTIWYVYGNGTIESADYWSLSLGKFDVTVERDFPGEGILPVSGSANLNFLSSGYIEGNGYGEKGKMIVNAEFTIMKDGVLTPIKLDEIDYIYYSATKVALKNETPQDLYLQIEKPSNKVQSKMSAIKVFAIDKEFGELKYKKDVERLIGFSFTKEGAQRAYKQALAE